MTRRKNKLPDNWRFDVRTIEYDDRKRPTVQAFIEQLEAACEGLTDPILDLSGEEGEYSSYVHISVTGTRPKTIAEIEREAELKQWQADEWKRVAKERRDGELKEAKRLFKKYKPLLIKEE